jgi:hypothetical protein
LIVWTRIQENTLCTYCNISYFPDHQNVKRPNKFETPGPETDIHGNVLTQDKPLLTAICPETWTKKKEDKLPKVFEALKGKGFSGPATRKELDDPENSCMDF